LDTQDLEIGQGKPKTLKLDMANLESFKLDTQYSKIRHCKLEIFKLYTLNHEIGHPMYSKIRHGKFKTFILNTLNLKIGHGKPKICQIEHLRPSNWT
jgi:hypothetical protein